MWLTNKLTTENGGVGFLPTSIGYKRKIQKQTEIMVEQQRKWKEQQAKIAEGKRQLKNLPLQTFYDNLDERERKQAETICVTQGYALACAYIKRVGMARWREKERRSSPRISSGIYY